MKSFIFLFLGASSSVHCRLNCNVSALVQLKAKGKAGSSDQLCCQVSYQADQNGFFQGSSSFPRQAGGDSVPVSEWQASVGLLPKTAMAHVHLACPRGAVPARVTDAWLGWMGAAQLIKALQWHLTAARLFLLQLCSVDKGKVAQGEVFVDLLISQHPTSTAAHTSYSICNTVTQAKSDRKQGFFT